MEFFFGIMVGAAGGFWLCDAMFTRPLTTEELVERLVKRRVTEMNEQKARDQVKQEIERAAEAIAKL